MKKESYKKEKAYGNGGGLSGEGLRKRKSRSAACFLLLLVLGLSGCQLAKEDAREKKDELCGVLVTTQEQEDAYWESHQGEIREPQEEITLTEREFKVLQRGGNLELLGQQEALGRKVEGVRLKNRDIVFEGLEGASLIAGFLEKDKAGDYRSFTSTGAFENVKANSNVTDEGEENSLEGTVSIDQEADVILNMNLVYQRPDGSFYALLDSTAGYWNSGQNSPGGVFSKSFKEEISQTVNGKSERMGQEFTVHVEVGKETAGVCVKEWNEEDELLKETAVQRGQEHFKLKEDTAYMVVEEAWEDGSVKRSIYTWDETAARERLLSHTVRYSNAYGLLIPETFSFEKD